MSAYRDFTTAQLVTELISSKRAVSSQLAQAIAARENVLPALQHILQDASYWSSRGPGGGWAPVHAIHILPLVKTPAALELLLTTLIAKNDELEDLLTENAPALLATFGEPAIDSLKTFIKDEAHETYARISACTALSVIAHRHIARAGSITDFLLHVMETTRDKTLAAFAVIEVLSLAGTSVFPRIYAAYDAGKINTGTLPPTEVEREYGKVPGELNYSNYLWNPLDYFSPEKRPEHSSFYDPRPITQISSHSNHTHAQQLSRGVSHRSRKVGRNYSCPCGSGRKYKKCCGLKTKDNASPSSF